MSQKHLGISFCNPLQTATVMHIMDGFVDDTTNWVNNFILSLTNRKLQMLTTAERLHESAQHWEQLLYSSGGALELKKCFYYYICWIFNEHANPVLHEISLLAIQSKAGACGKYYKYYSTSRNWRFIIIF
jgi:hypothetical protein